MGSAGQFTTVLFKSKGIAGEMFWQRPGRFLVSRANCPRLQSIGGSTRVGPQDRHILTRMRWCMFFLPRQRSSLVGVVVVTLAAHAWTFQTASPVRAVEPARPEAKAAAAWKTLAGQVE